MTKNQEIIIIGAGPAGLTAGLYLGRFNFKPLILTGLSPGGHLINTDVVENYPGFPQGVAGPQLAQLYLSQAERFGAEIVYESVTKVDFKKKPFAIWTNNQQQEPNYTAQVVLIASGSQARKLALPEEEKFLGKGLAFCATCDGPLYKNKTVAVIGSGNKALEEALLLSTYAEKVYLIARSAQFKAEAYLQEQIKKEKKIVSIFHRQVKALIGENRLEKIQLLNTQLDSLPKEEELLVDGVFLAIGQIPNTEIFKSFLPTDEQGYLLTKTDKQTSQQTATAIEGVFVAGDIISRQQAQITVAVGSGTLAAMEIRDFLTKK